MATTTSTDDHTPGQVAADAPSQTARDQPPPASSPTPLPKKEFTVLFFILCNESIAMTVLFPFVGLLIVHMNPDMRRADAGSLSGAIVAAFQFSQFFFARYWGAKSDKIGRRPAIMYGIVGSMISVIMFGFAPNVGFAIAARLLQGMASGNDPVCKTSIAELTDSSNEAMGFTWMNAGWSVGSMIGPVIGGLAYAPCGSSDAGAATVATGGSGQRAANATKTTTTSSATTSLLTTMITTTNSSSCFHSPFPTSPAPPSLTDPSSPPWLCHTFPIFADRPQLLPCLIVAVYNLLTLVMAYFVLPETNQRVAAAAANHRPASAKIPVPTTVDDDDGDDGDVQMKSTEVHTTVMMMTDAVGLQEPEDSLTSPHDHHHHQYDAQSEVSLTSGESAEEQNMEQSQNDPATTTTEATPTKFGYKQVFQNGTLVRCISTYMCCCAVGIVLNEVLPLLAILPTADGGYGWNAQEVGVLWTITAFFALFMNFCLSPLVARFGRLRVAKVSFLSWAVMMMVFPSLSNLAENNNGTGNLNGHDCGEKKIIMETPSASSSLFYGLLCTAALIRTACTSWCFALSTMFITAQAPREHLGSVTGLSHSSGNIVRCVVPLIVTPLFAWSVRTHDRPFPFNSYFVFLLASVFAVGGMLLVAGLKQSDVIRDNTNWEEEEEEAKKNNNSESDDISHVERQQQQQQQQQEEDEEHGMPPSPRGRGLVRGTSLVITVDDDYDDRHLVVQLHRKESMSPREEAIAQTALTSPMFTMNCLSETRQRVFSL